MTRNRLRDMPSANTGMVRANEAVLTGCLLEVHSVVVFMGFLHVRHPGGRSFCVFLRRGFEFLAAGFRTEIIGTPVIEAGPRSRGIDGHATHGIDGLGRRLTSGIS